MEPARQDTAGGAAPLPEVRTFGNSRSRPNVRDRWEATRSEVRTFGNSRKAYLPESLALRRLRLDVPKPPPRDPTRRGGRPVTPQVLQPQYSCRARAGVGKRVRT